MNKYYQWRWGVKYRYEGDEAQMDKEVMWWTSVPMMGPAEWTEDHAGV